MHLIELTIKFRFILAVALHRLYLLIVVNLLLVKVDLSFDKYRNLLDDLPDGSCFLWGCLFCTGISLHRMNISLLWCNP